MIIVRYRSRSFQHHRVPRELRASSARAPRELGIRSGNPRANAAHADASQVYNTMLRRFPADVYQRFAEGGNRSLPAFCACLYGARASVPPRPRRQRIAPFDSASIFGMGDA